MSDLIPCQLGDIFRPPVAYPMLTCAALAAGDYEHEYLIDAILVKDQPAILAGAKKCLKTNISVDLGLSLATRSPFLGRFKVATSHRTVLMSGESGLSTLQETAKRICKAKGLTLASVDDLLWSERLPQFGDDQHLLAVERLVQSEAVKVLVIDPAYLAMPSSDPANMFEQGRLLRGMNDVCQAHGVTMILVHHCRKNQKSQFEPPELEEIAWAGFQEWARQWILLGRRDKYEPASGLHQLWMSVGGSAGHSGLWGLTISEGTERPRKWDVEIDSAEETRADDREEKQEQSLAQIADRLLIAAMRFPDGASKTKLRETVGCSGARATAAVDSLLLAKRLRAEKKKNCVVYVPVIGA